MPDQNPDAEAALQKLGQRVRDGFAKQHPTQEKDLEAVRNAVSEQYDQEKKAEREEKPASELDKNAQQKSPEQDLDR